MIRNVQKTIEHRKETVSTSCRKYVCMPASPTSEWPESSQVPQVRLVQIGALFALPILPPVAYLEVVNRPLFALFASPVARGYLKDCRVFLEFRLVAAALRLRDGRGQVSSIIILVCVGVKF